MTSGFDRYFQIAPCFRDEDARGDRSPGEFYQLDMEMAFATQEDVFAVLEDVLPPIFAKFGTYNVASAAPFRRIPYNTALETYGSDKPDLRIDLTCKNVSRLFENSEFEPLRGQTVKMVDISDCTLTRKQVEKLLSDCEVQSGSKAYWFKVDEKGELAGGIAKFVTDLRPRLEQVLTLAPNTLVVVAAGASATKSAGVLIKTFGAACAGHMDKERYEFCWIVDFPMYEIGDESGELEFCHNPFSMPSGGLEVLLKAERGEIDPLTITADQYDLVCNGVELSSGAVRNHDPEIMVKAFELVRLGEEDVKKKFPAMYNAFCYGAPPHAGLPHTPARRAAGRGCISPLGRRYAPRAVFPHHWWNRCTAFRLRSAEYRPATLRLLQQSQALLPFQHPAHGSVNLSFIDLPGRHSLQHRGDLGGIIGCQHHIVARLQGQHRRRAAGSVFLQRVHGQIIGQNHAFKSQLSAQDFMHRRRKRSRICFVHACDNIVRHQHRRRTGPDPCFERQKIRLHKALIGPLIQGNAGVGVQIIPIARKMLQHAANAGTVHFFHHSGHIFRRLLRRRAQRAGIDIIPGVGGNVAHRGKVDVDAQPQQEGRLFRRIAAQSGQTPGSVQRLGRGKLVGAQMGVTLARTTVPPSSSAPISSGMSADCCNSSVKARTWA